MNHLRLTVDEFLDQVAARTPTPGGGGVTALTGALACALARMTAAYSSGGKVDPLAGSQAEVMEQRLRRADEMLRRLMDEDAAAYEQMVKAAKDAKKNADERPAYLAAVRAALIVPMQMAAVVSEALATMDEYKAIVNPSLLSDLAAAAVLAEAAARAARHTVQVNLRELGDLAHGEKTRADIDAIAQHGRHHAESIERYVAGRLEERGADSR